MMEKRDIIEFFDGYAAKWDQDMVINPGIIRLILDHAGVKSGKKILDVACGTGVLFEFYHARHVSSVTAIDIAPQMAEIAAEKTLKFPEIQVICGDVEEVVFAGKFDCIMVYNALPHFPDPRKLITILADLLTPQGRLSIAHGFSRDKINRHHSGVSKVSRLLPDIKELEKFFKGNLSIEKSISNDEMYQIVGKYRVVSDSDSNDVHDV